MRILFKFSSYDCFEEFCKRDKAYCPVEEENKGNDQHKPCHWCRVAFDHGFNAYRDEVEKRLE